ncbi:metalloregulator ArsR/SmtB family transcription factor [Paenibacillus jamilae]|uniref:ArsR/SmtB family transcription factor n=1 Tax=Bacillus cereus group TaxID=86661 RepID=UPI001298B4A2|nr:MULTISPECIES: metalloregulator ArsR/SmtB family transcription factor [Bacillus cereus group]MEB4843068.1 metalloregulator ArsR/SmtB family transcription factor [Paenibacillus jamilae]MEB8830935.1 metalloregulator ArsR/SmtB family transcription factor [Bacillus cereus]MCR6856622.1 metalloregulator ArsR/SmtB family transcription factor [Bacillus thuringiensis]MEB9274889.1 metalloregulator ArsR/SmtB family transcription factor [Bacillus cereus]MEC3037316.1 metalloregulator ArsR/SmtB family tra
MKYTKTNMTNENIEMLKTLSHPIRVEIITILMQHKTLNVSELVNKLQIPQSTVSQHLSKMKGRIVSCDRRGLEVYYYISNPIVPQIIEILLPNNK